jgi:cytoskeletal protein RodZ
MLKTRFRNKHNAADRRGVDRWWRRNRTRGEELAERLSSEVIPDLAHRLEDLRDDAKPYVQEAAKHVPRRRRSRKGQVARLVAALAFAAAVAVVAYLIWQRRDQEPARLVEEPDQPLTTPGDPEPGTPDLPSNGPAADSAPSETREDADAVAHPYRPATTEREPARSSWTATNREVAARPVEPVPTAEATAPVEHTRPPETPRPLEVPRPLEAQRPDASLSEPVRQESRADALGLPSTAPRAPQGQPSAARDQLPRTTIRPDVPR